MAVESEAMAREPTQREQRWGSRTPLNALAELITADGDFEAVRVRDASLSGAYVETQRSLPIMMRVALCPSGRAGEWLDGIVVRSDGGGYGIEWLDPGLHPVSVLLSLRHHATHRPTAPRRASSRVSWGLVERLKR